MEPGKHGVGVDVVIEVGQEVAEYEALLARPVGGHPQPPVAEVVVDEEDVALLEPGNNEGAKLGFQKCKKCS